jgi:hypothetical protein
MPESREPISSFGDGYKLAEELINASCLYKPWRLEKREIATIHCKVAPHTVGEPTPRACSSSGGGLYSRMSFSLDTKLRVVSKFIRFNKSF